MVADLALDRHIRRDDKSGRNRWSAAPHFTGMFRSAPYLNSRSRSLRCSGFRAYAASRPIFLPTSCFRLTGPSTNFCLYSYTRVGAPGSDSSPSALHSLIVLAANSISFAIQGCDLYRISRPFAFELDVHGFGREYRFGGRCARLSGESATDAVAGSFGSEFGVRVNLVHPGLLFFLRGPGFCFAMRKARAA